MPEMVRHAGVENTNSRKRGPNEGTRIGMFKVVVLSRNEVGFLTFESESLTSSVGKDSDSESDSEGSPESSDCTLDCMFVAGIFLPALLM